MSPIFSNARCEQCSGPIIVVNTIKSSLATIRYIGCRRCGWRPFNNKLVEMKAAGASRRNLRFSSNNK